jgi:hypothetical protein
MSTPGIPVNDGLLYKLTFISGGNDPIFNFCIIFKFTHKKIVTLRTRNKKVSDYHYDMYVEEPSVVIRIMTLFLLQSRTCSLFILTGIIFVTFSKFLWSCIICFGIKIFTGGTHWLLPVTLKQ